MQLTKSASMNQGLSIQPPERSPASHSGNVSMGRPLQSLPAPRHDGIFAEYEVEEVEDEREPA